MNQRQTIIVWLWIAAIVALGLYPPWLQNHLRAGYDLLFLGKEWKHVNYPDLILEWALATVLAAGFYFAWPFKRR
jgi:hypothetical protein